jgi:hypothetical protein
MPDANELLRINHEVTSERDPEKRRAAIERAYVEDLRFIDSSGEVVGRQAFSDRVQKILDDAPGDFVLEEEGLAYVGPDTAAQPWRGCKTACTRRTPKTASVRRQTRRCCSSPTA